MKGTEKLTERVGAKEREYVEEVLQTQFRKTPNTSMTARLEKLFAQKFQSGYAISFINGTATMHAALAAMGIGPGDEVIVPPLTMAATSMAVLHAGAVPVFADIDPDTWNIDPRSIERCITPRTRAIIPVAIYGLAPDLDSILTIAGRHGLRVLEDDAQCFLGYIGGKIVGTLGDAASFSFQNSKHMTSGEGGMIITSNAELAGNIRRFANLGYAAVTAEPGGSKISRDTIQSPTYKRHVSVGWNYRLPELCAAVALAQLEKLEEFVESRIAVARLYESAIEGCSWLKPQPVPAGYRHSYWTYALHLQQDTDRTWSTFRAKFLEFGGDHFYGAWMLTYLEPPFENVRFSPNQPQEFQSGLCPVAERIQPCLVQLKTNYLNMGRARQQAQALKRTIEFFER